MFFLFFKQKTAYEMRISDWSSDVCSSDLFPNECAGRPFHARRAARHRSATGCAKCRDGNGALLRTDRHKIRHCGGVGQGGGGHYLCWRPRWPGWPHRAAARSEERGVGKACVRTCRSRWARDHIKKKKYKDLRT